MKNLKFLFYFIATGLFCIVLVSVFLNLLRGSYFIVWGFLKVISQNSADVLDIIIIPIGFALIIPIYFICLPWIAYQTAKRKVYENMEFYASIIETLRHGRNLLGKIPIIGKIFREHETDWKMEKKKHIEELLEKKDDENIRKFNECLGKQFFMDGNKLDIWEKDVYFVTTFFLEIKQGGFFQYFRNHSGDFAHETLLALQNIKADECSKYFTEAMLAFPYKIVPKEIEIREKILNVVEQGILEKWHEIDDNVYKSIDILKTLLMNFISQKIEFDE